MKDYFGFSQNRNLNQIENLKNELKKMGKRNKAAKFKIIQIKSGTKIYLF